MKEKIAEGVEKKMDLQLNQNENTPQKDNKIKMVSKKNLKDIKKKLIKGYYRNLEQVKNEVLDVIDYFLKENEITSDEEEEYRKLIECFFSDAKQIIEE